MQRVNEIIDVTQNIPVLISYYQTRAYTGG